MSAQVLDRRRPRGPAPLLVAIALAITLVALATAASLWSGRTQAPARPVPAQVAPSLPTASLHRDLHRDLHRAYARWGTSHVPDCRPRAGCGSSGGTTARGA